MPTTDPAILAFERLKTLGADPARHGRVKSKELDEKRNLPPLQHVRTDGQFGQMPGTTKGQARYQKKSLRGGSINQDIINTIDQHGMRRIPGTAGADFNMYGRGKRVNRREIQSIQNDRGPVHLKSSHQAYRMRNRSKETEKAGNLSIQTNSNFVALGI